MQRPRPDEDAVRDLLRERPVPTEDAEPSQPDEESSSSGSDDGVPPGPAEPEPVSVDPDVPTAGLGADGAGADGGDPDGPEAVESSPEEEVARQRDEYLALAQRTQAEFDNYRKRAAKDVAAAGARAKGNLAHELLPAVDNLERALASAGEGEHSLAEGVRLVHAELLGALQRGGIVPFDPAGEPFDPVHHEALTTRPEEGVGPGVVLDVVQKGYRSGETVLRPARVVVSA